MTLIGLDAATRLISIGTLTIDTTGTPEQIPAQRCKMVVIQTDEANSSLGDGAIIAVGGSTVDALSDPPVATAMLYATQRDTFRCHDASELYIDSTENGAQISYAIFG